MNMGGGSGIFGNFVANQADLDNTLDPVMRYLDPGGAFSHREINKFQEKTFNPKMPEAPQHQAKTLPTMVSSNGAAKAGAAGPVAATGGGFGARDMVTAPPNNPEGNKMRFGKASLLGVAE